MNTRFRKGKFSVLTEDGYVITQDRQTLGTLRYCENEWVFCSCTQQLTKGTMDEISDKLDELNKTEL